MKGRLIKRPFLIHSCYANLRPQLVYTTEMIVPVKLYNAHSYGYFVPDKTTVSANSLT